MERKNTKKKLFETKMNEKIWNCFIVQLFSFGASHHADVVNINVYLKNIHYTIRQFRSKLFAAIFIRFVHFSYEFLAFPLHSALPSKIRNEKTNKKQKLKQSDEKKLKLKKAV